MPKTVVLTAAHSNKSMRSANMKVFIVMVQDTNFINTIDKVFLSNEDANSYIQVKDENRDDLFYFIREYLVESTKHIPEI